MKPFGAYVHARPDGRIFYIGKGKEYRARSLDPHQRNAHHGNIVRKYGKDNISIGFIPCSSEALAFELEKGLIKCTKRMGLQLTNRTDGGDGATGHRHDAATIERIREAAIKHFADPEVRRKVAEKSTGRKHPESAKEKIRQSAYGNRRGAGRVASVAGQEASRERTHQQMSDPAARKRISDVHRGNTHASGLKWVKRNGKYARIAATALPAFLADGWQVGGGVISKEHSEKLRLSGLGRKQSAETISKRIAKTAGQRRTEEVRRKMSEKAKGNSNAEGSIRSIEQRLAISLSKRGVPTNSGNTAAKGLLWMHREGEQARIKPEQLEAFIVEGWKRGRK